MSTKVPVSVLIPIKNEAANLPRCLQSVSWADEIIVVDSQSTDGSDRHRAGARRDVSCSFSSTVSGRKRKTGHWRTSPFVMNGSSFSMPMKCCRRKRSEEFADAIAQAGPIAGYWINRRFMFMGRWLRHAYYPNWNLRLFRHSLGRYEKLTDSPTDSGDNEVHEHVIVNGPTGKLRCELDHYAFPTVEVFVEKHNRYSNWEARVAADRFLKGHRRTFQRNAGWSSAEIETVLAPHAFPSVAAFSLHLHLAKRISRRARRLLFRATARGLRIFVRRENARAEEAERNSVSAIPLSSRANARDLANYNIA